MEKPILILALNFFLMTGLHAQVTGMWKITDENSKVEKSVVEIFEKDNAYHGRVVRILPTSKRTHCDQCENTYSCYIELVGPDRLKLRGYLGFPAFGKTMYYNRLKS